MPCAGFAVEGCINSAGALIVDVPSEQEASGSTGIEQGRVGVRANSSPRDEAHARAQPLSATRLAFISSV